MIMRIRVLIAVSQAENRKKDWLDWFALNPANTYLKFI
jgi:hypothetical protein